MKWRERWNVDNILDWKTPQPLAEYSPHGISGFDKEGSPSNLVNALFLLNVKTYASIFSSLSLSLFLSLFFYSTLFHNVCSIVCSPNTEKKQTNIKRIHSNRGTVCWHGYVGNVAYGVPSRFYSINY